MKNKINPDSFLTESIQRVKVVDHVKLSLYLDSQQDKRHREFMEHAKKAHADNQRQMLIMEKMLKKILK